MELTRYVQMSQRRALTVPQSQSFLFALLEPLFMIDTHMFFEERIQLFKLAFALPGKFVACEVGSYLGASTAFLAAAASVHNGHIHAVDTWQNDAMPMEPVEETYEKFLENTKFYRHVITAHRGRAEALAHEIPAIDMLFVDGDHSYEGTKAVLNDYAPKLKPQGILAMHDFIDEPVARAVREYYKPDALVDLGLIYSLQSYRLK